MVSNMPLHPVLAAFEGKLKLVGTGAALRGATMFTVYDEILSSERNKQELSGFNSIEFVSIAQKVPESVWEYLRYFFRRLLG